VSDFLFDLIWCGLYFWIPPDDMRKLCPKYVFASAYATIESHRLVLQTETEPTAATKETKRATLQSAAFVGLPHRSSYVLNLFARHTIGLSQSQVILR
jgi:hypothetical protein